MKFKKAIFTILLITCVAPISNAQLQEGLKKISDVFEEMEFQGVDTKSELLYGYFFFADSKNDLDNLKYKLLNEKYRFVRSELTEDNSFMLHVEKTEIHSRQSLFERGLYLDSLSKAFQVDYDGWDVGNKDPLKSLVTPESFVIFLADKPDQKLYEIAMYLYDHDNYEKAILAFKLCIEHNYKKDTCHYKTGNSYNSLGDLTKAIEHLKFAIKINPKYFEACFNLANTYSQNLDFNKSLEYYLIALKLNPDQDDTLHGVAACYYSLEDYKSSDIYNRKALGINPANENAKTLAEMLKKKL